LGTGQRAFRVLLCLVFELEERRNNDWSENGREDSTCVAECN
jgi:hypothetical protein